MLAKLLRFLFFATIARIVVLIVLGLNIRHREKLPAHGPAIIVANHNSHLDTLVLMTLMPLRLLPRLRPVAAMDYFLRNKWLAWFATYIIGILPIQRKVSNRKDNPLSGCIQSLHNGDILILFPEGSRGAPEHMSQFKTGIARLAEQCPEVPVTPVYLHGLGKALPKGETLLVPFFCDVFIGDALEWRGDRRDYMQTLDETMHALANEGNFQTWD